jgi:hypothetical protein
MKQPHEYIGVSVTETYLTVSFACGARGARRLAEVKVPLLDLDQELIWKLMDKAVARRLIEMWSQEPLDLQVEQQLADELD